MIFSMKSLAEIYAIDEVDVLKVLSYSWQLVLSDICEKVSYKSEGVFS